jgi:hypothetical protein
MATGTAGTPDSIQAAAGFIPSGTSAQRSRLSLDGELLQDPYPLVETPDGSVSIAWFDRARTVAFITPIISIILALFGKAWPRTLLVSHSGCTALRDSL